MFAARRIVSFHGGAAGRIFARVVPNERTMTPDDPCAAVPPALWHAVPLHYAPHLFATGALFSKNRLKAAGLPIQPRSSAWRRDTRLGLSGYVHLSLSPRTPLLADKRRKGYPHLLIAFDAAAVFALPGTALLPFNTKAWRHRDDFAPVTNADEKTALLEARRAGRHPSLEVLVPGALALAPHVRALHAASEAEADWLRAFARVVPYPAELPLFTSPGLFAPGPAPDLSAHADYQCACRAAGVLLAPPDLPFD